ncbi:hypothetical protein Tco_0576993 [Tanacetum coccineum]
MVRVDVDTLIMEQYLALSRENQAPGVTRMLTITLIGSSAPLAYLIFLESLKTHSCSEFSLHSYWSRKKMGGQTRPRNYQYLGSPQKGLYPKVLPTFHDPKQLEDIHNFKQEGDESLYQACERYNDLLYKCPTHDINKHQKVNIFYKGLSTMNRQLLDSQGPIPGMRPTEALTAIQTMADHSQK